MSLGNKKSSQIKVSNSEDEERDICNILNAESFKHPVYTWIISYFLFVNSVSKFYYHFICAILWYILVPIYEPLKRETDQFGFLQMSIFIIRIIITFNSQVVNDLIS